MEKKSTTLKAGYRISVLMTRGHYTPSASNYIVHTYHPYHLHNFRAAIAAPFPQVHDCVIGVIHGGVPEIVQE